MKNKKILLGVLAVTLVFGTLLAACSSGGAGSSNNNNNNTGGGTSNVLTIKNSTDKVIAKVQISNANTGATLVNNASLSIQPGETYTSPELNASYVNWSAEYAGIGPVLGAWTATSNCDWEIYPEGGWYNARRVSNKQFPGA